MLDLLFLFIIGELSSFLFRNTAMVWANGNARIDGHDDGTIDATGTTIRAQTASILMRFDQNLVEH